MRNLTIGLLFLITLTAQAQNTHARYGSWEFLKYTSNFDGTYSAAACTGTGEFPYNKPAIALRQQEGEEVIEVIAINVAHGVGDGCTYKVRFDDGKLYEGSAGVSKDGSTWFLYFSDQAEFISHLKSGNKLVLRLETRYSTNDYTFKLNGSTAAINRL